MKNSDEEEDDGTTCKSCKIPWLELTERCAMNISAQSLTKDFCR